MTNYVIYYGFSIGTLEPLGWFTERDANEYISDMLDDDMIIVVVKVDRDHNDIRLLDDDVLDDDVLDDDVLDDDVLDDYDEEDDDDE